MKYLNLKKHLAILAIFAFAFSACKKINTAEPMGDAGQTLVKIIGGSNPTAPGIKTFAINFVAIPTKLLVVELRRDIPNNAELNKSMTVTVKDDTAAVTAANAAYIQLPTAWYTIQGDGVKTGGQGGMFTFTFKAGEFAKEIYITVPDATLLNPSSLYGLGFTVTGADAGGKVSASKSLVVEIGAKNNYDGVYDDVFTNYHPSLNPGYIGGSTVIHFITTGANKVKMYWPYAGVFACPSNLGGASLQYFGSQEPEFTINTITNAVTVQNAFIGAVTFYNMNSSFNSYYDPATKTFYVKWGYNNPGGVFIPGTSREWTQTLKYTGPR